MTTAEIEGGKHYMCHAASLLAGGSNLVMGHRGRLGWLEEFHTLIPEGGDRLQLWFINEQVADATSRIRNAISTLPVSEGALDALALDIAQHYEEFCNFAEDTRPFLSLRVIDEKYFESNVASVSSHYHRDAASLTFFCTYAGLGTQWVADHNVRREYFKDRQKQTFETADSEVLLNPNEVYITEIGHIGLLKGELSPTEPDPDAREFVSNFRSVESLPRFNSGKGLIHRGPRSLSVEPRLVLTISSFLVPRFLTGDIT